MINTSKISSFFSELKIIISLFLIIISLVVWAQDTRYVTYSALDVRDIKQIRREIADLQVEKRYADTIKDRQKSEDKIQQKEQQIKEIKGE